MAAARAIFVSAAFLLALPIRSAAAQEGEAATNYARTPAPASPPLAVSMRDFPPGCAVAVRGGRSGSGWHLPRATLVVANRSSHRVLLGMEARAGIEAAGSEFGSLEPGETRTFRHAVPAGRSVVLAQRQDSGATHLRQPIYIWNYGPLTCQRRFVWALR